MVIGAGSKQPWQEARIIRVGRDEGPLGYVQPHGIGIDAGCENSGGRLAEQQRLEDALADVSPRAEDENYGLAGGGDASLGRDE